MIEPRRRAAAVVALLLVAAAAIVVGIGEDGLIASVVIAPAVLLLTTATAWEAVTRRGVVRVLAIAATVVLLGFFATVVLSKLGLLVVVALLGASAALVPYALGRDRRALRALAVPGVPVGPARRGVLIANLKSGGGKVERFGLVEECHRRGIEAVVLQPGDDLLELARKAIDRGADVIGMAGGDGSQALVASAAAAAGVPLVCVPAGTRNHFAIDLGLDAGDVVAALDAFDDGASERQIDLGEVNGHVFVNNVSLGVYATIIQSSAYRAAKGKTTTAMMSKLLGPDAEPFDLHFVGPDGVRRDDARIIQISNNPYGLASATAFGSRPRLDTGQLGIAAAAVRGAWDVTAFVAAQWMRRLHRFRGWELWNAESFTVDSGGPVEAAIDGEASKLDPPLAFVIRPGALRVRIPASAPGYAPAALKAGSAWWTLSALVLVAGGRAVSL